MKVDKIAFFIVILALATGVDANARCVTGDQTVRASSFGWKADDATECLQKAIDSGVARILVDRQVGDWIVRPILVTGRRNQELLFEDGVTVRAKKNAFKGKNDCLFSLKKCRNFTMRGLGNVQFVMRKADYQDPKRYAPSEWRHAIWITGGENIVIDNFAIRSSGGDAVELAYNPRNIRLANLVCRDHHRQGLSVCAAIDLLVTNCVFSLTKGTPPMAGVDIEPFRADDRLERVVFSDCTFDDNASYGIDIHLNDLCRRSAPASCAFRRCKCRGNRFAALAVYGNSAGKALGPQGPCRGTVLFEECEGFGNGAFGMLRYMNVVSNGLRTVLRNCTFDVTGSESPLLIGSDIPSNVAGLVCENVRVIGTNAVKPGFSPESGAGAVECRGDLTFVSDEGVATTVDLEKWAAGQPQDPSLFAFEAGIVDFGKLCPLHPGRSEKAIPCGSFANKFTFVQCTPEAGEYAFRFDLSQWQGVPAATGSFTLRDALGTDLGEHRLKPGRNDFTFKSSAGNVLRFEFKTRNGAVSVSSWARGCGVLAVSPLRCFGAAHRYYFQVPATAETVRVKQSFGVATGALYDAAGMKVGERTKEESSNRTFLAKRTKTTEPEIWAFDFRDSNWEVITRIGAPALPIVSLSKDAMIVERR